MLHGTVLFVITHTHTHIHTRHTIHITHNTHTHTRHTIHITHTHTRAHTTHNTVLLLMCSYSTDGMLVTVDSLGIVRGLSTSFGISWSPLLDMNSNVRLIVCVYWCAFIDMLWIWVYMQVVILLYVLCLCKCYSLKIFTNLLLYCVMYSTMLLYMQLTKKTDMFFVIGITCDPYEIKLVQSLAYGLLCIDLP